MLILLLSANTVVCIDGYFIQKCNKTRGKDSPPNHHPLSVFISEANAKAVKCFIKSCQLTSLTMLKVAVLSMMNMR